MRSKRLGLVILAVIASALAMAASSGPARATILPEGGGAHTNYSAVVSYAHQYAGVTGGDNCSGWNPEYICMNNDCTDFVSQALLAGGWNQITSGPAGGQWWYFDDDPWPATQDTWSATWGSVQDFSSWAYNTGRGIFVNSGAIWSNARWSVVVPGDILLVNESGGTGGLDHAEIVTSTSGVGYGNVTPSDIKITQHTTNRYDYPLTNDHAAWPNAKWTIMEPY
jgi:Putative amidase domain